MKKITLYLCTICLLFVTSCNNDDDNNSGDTLPPETQIGANTVGCLINGEIFLPKQEGINPSVVVNYEFIDGEFFFSLTFNDHIGIGIKSVNIRTQRLDLEINQIYELNKNYDDNDDYTGGGGTYGINAENYYYTTSSITGELTITRVDLSNSIISGTFWFDAINDTGGIVEIREGRFDYEY